ncbi:MAG: TetR/AcrR family transcriptional regulator [Ottowia sp.]
MSGATTTDRREELIHKAAHLFRANGFKGTTTRDIAAAAGMQSGSPFYYFESKGALLCAVMQTGMAIATANQDRVLAAMSPHATPREQLQALVSAHLHVLFGDGRDFMPVLAYEWPWLTDAQRQAVVAQKDAYEAAWMPALTGLHRRGELRSRPEVARFFIFGALNWTVHWFRPDGSLSVDDLAEEAMKLFVDRVA